MFFCCPAAIRSDRLAFPRMHGLFSPGVRCTLCLALNFGENGVAATLYVGQS